MSQSLESLALAARFSAVLSGRRWRTFVSLSHILAICVIGVAGSVAFGESASDKTGAPQIGYEPNLPVIFLESTNQIVGDRDRKVPGTIRILYPRAKTEATKPMPAAVRFHGASSQGYPKKSFAIAFNSPAALLGMRESPHWILNAAYIDRSLMRHKLSYDLFRSLSTPGARRFAAASRFVEAHFNGGYNGVYLLMERVDAQLLELLSYNSNDVRHACVYKAVDHAGGFSNPGHAGYDQREPDQLLHPYWKPLDGFSRFVSSARDAEFFDPVAGVASRLDLDNAIDFHLLVLLTSNVDGTDKNFILAQDGQTSGPIAQKFFFAPWDYDATFGRNWNATPVESTAWLSIRLFDRLLSNTEYRKKFVARWKQLRNGAFSPKNIQNLIDDNVRTLGPAVQRNARRWPTNQGPYPDSLQFAEDIAQMKSWTEARVKWLDQEIERTLNHGGR